MVPFTLAFSTLPPDGPRHIHEAELTEDVQGHLQSSPIPEIGQQHIEYDYHHPAAFSFPTLSPDGSIEDLSIVPIRHSTPPAALSSLGVKARMAQTDRMSDSVSSLADSQYDMIDDISEISTDDRETASLASTEHQTSDDDDDGQMTPDEGSSVVDVEQEHRAAMEKASLVPTSNARLLSELIQSPRDQASASRDVDASMSNSQAARTFAEAVVDSFLSDDLETPRQSTLPLQIGPQKRASKAKRIVSERPLRLLFISERTVPEVEKDTICAKIAASLAGSEDVSNCRIVKLPATPSGITPSSSTLFRDGNIQLDVQHCVGAVVDDGAGDASPLFYAHILDNEGLHSSVLAVNEDTKPKLAKPDMAITYLHQEQPTWLSVAKMAMQTIAVPVLNLGREVYVPNSSTRNDPPKPGMQADMSAAYLQDMPDGDVVDLLNNLLSNRKHIPNLRAPSNVASRKKFQAGSLDKTGVMGVVLAIVLFLALMVKFQSSASLIPEVALRRELLETALTKMGLSSDVTRTVNIDHLLPQASATSLDAFGRKIYALPTSVPYAPLSSNHVIFSFPKRSAHGSYPTPISVTICRGHHQIPFNQTKLIDGVYDIALDPAEAHGDVRFVLTTKNPAMNTTAYHKFGNRLFQRHIYEKAGTELSKSVNNELTVARQAAESLGSKIQLELSAGAAATRNVTSQLALYMARDLQVFARSAVSVLSKAANARNQTAATIKNELMLVRKDLVKISQDLQNTISSTAQKAKTLIPSKKSVASPLALSRERALGLKQRLFGQQKKKNLNSSSPITELSTYMQSLLKPLRAKTNKPSRFERILTCMRTPDDKACLKEQDRQALSAQSCMTSSLSTVPDRNLFSNKQQKVAEKKVKAKSPSAKMARKLKKVQTKADQIMNKAEAKKAKKQTMKAKMYV